MKIYINNYKKGNCKFPYEVHYVKASGFFTYREDCKREREASKRNQRSKSNPSRRLQGCYKKQNVSGDNTQR